MKVTVLSYIGGFIETPTIFEKPFLSAHSMMLTMWPRFSHAPTQENCHVHSNS